MTGNIHYKQLERGYGADETRAISAQNTFTTAVALFGPFSLSISGTWVGTVTIQRSFDSGTTWLDVQNYTANFEDTGNEPRRTTLYRVGFKTGGYTSGTANVRIGQ